MTKDQQRALWRQMYKEGWRLHKSCRGWWSILRPAVVLAASLVRDPGLRLASLYDFATRGAALAEACRIYRLTRKPARRIQRTNEHRKTGR